MAVFSSAACHQLLRHGKLAGFLSLLAVMMTMTASAQTLTMLANLSAFNDSPWRMSFAQGTDGNLYGTSLYGGTYGNGTVFEITPSGALITLYSFCGVFGCNDGAYPCGGLVQGSDGNLYGATEFGGTWAEGTIFKVNPDGTLTTIYSFCSQPGCVDGMNPCGPLVHASDGNFYGTTVGGGNEPCDYGCGTVFKITERGVLTSIHRFCSENGCADGASPNSGLIQARDGNLYGTTFGGGTRCTPGCGTIFRITPRGTFTMLHDFGGTDGDIITAGLIQAADGDFYGTAARGGTDNDGTVFKVNSIGDDLTVVHNFHGNDGSEPYTGVIQASDGNFYGTTTAGGTNCSDQFDGCGTVFLITPRNRFHTLYLFQGSDGYDPDNPLLQGTNGSFYGTNVFGGASGQGTVFELSVGLNPFVSFVQRFGRIGQTSDIVGQGFTGTTTVMFNGMPANFTVVSDTLIKATVPPDATSGYVTVTTPPRVLTSNVPFRVIP